MPTGGFRLLRPPCSPASAAAKPLTLASPPSPCLGSGSIGRGSSGRGSSGGSGGGSRAKRPHLTDSCLYGDGDDAKRPRADSPSGTGSGSGGGGTDSGSGGGGTDSGSGGGGTDSGSGGGGTEQALPQEAQLQALEALMLGRRWRDALNAALSERVRVAGLPGKYGYEQALVQIMAVSSAHLHAAVLFGASWRFGVDDVYVVLAEEVEGEARAIDDDKAAERRIRKIKLRLHPDKLLMFPAGARQIAADAFILLTLGQETEGHLVTAADAAEAATQAARDAGAAADDASRAAAAAGRGAAAARAAADGGDASAARAAAATAAADAATASDAAADAAAAAAAADDASAKGSSAYNAAFTVAKAADAHVAAGGYPRVASDAHAAANKAAEFADDARYYHEEAEKYRRDAAAAAAAAAASAAAASSAAATAPSPAISIVIVSSACDTGDDDDDDGDGGGSPSPAATAAAGRSSENGGAGSIGGGGSRAPAAAAALRQCISCISSIGVDLADANADVAAATEGLRRLAAQDEAARTAEFDAERQFAEEREALRARRGQLDGQMEAEMVRRDQAVEKAAAEHELYMKLCALARTPESTQACARATGLLQSQTAEDVGAAEAGVAAVAAAQAELTRRVGELEQARMVAREEATSTLRSVAGDIARGEQAFVAATAVAQRHAAYLAEVQQALAEVQQALEIARGAL